MIALPLLLLCASELVEVPAQPLEWERLHPEVFDLRWRLPEARREGRDLLAEMRRLLAVEARTTQDEVLRFGDLVRQSRTLPEAARPAWFARQDERIPRFIADWGAGMSELILDGFLGAKAWQPGQDDARDGILLADTWELGAAAGEPWSGIGVTVGVEQAAVLIFADLRAIKTAENDYRAYPDHVGADYEHIYPLRETHFRGVDPSGDPWSALAIHFRSDLPFPYSHYDCTLRILNSYAQDGTPRTDIYSTSPDFHWLAGRDVFLPVEDSRGERVAWMLVRHFGFDVDDVPDRSKHRHVALRSSLGNLKLEAEALAAARKKNAPRAEGPEDLTHFRVVGVR